MNKVNFHINEIEWETFTGEKWGPLRWKELLNLAQGISKEFIFGLAELPAGGKLPLHTHQQAETDYILSGKARIRLGSRSVESTPTSALYFPGKQPHSIEALGSDPLRYIYTYACEKLGHQVDLEFADEEAALQVDIVNKGNTRWAIREECEEWICVEPSKGFGIRVRRLFDNERGNTHEMAVGMGENDPGTHYTLHYHEQPEIYYVLSGCGVVYVKDSAIEASPGSALYIGKRVVHGIDCLGVEPMRVYYVYGAETAGHADTWTPVEDIYNEAHWRK